MEDCAAALTALQAEQGRQWEMTSGLYPQLISLGVPFTDRHLRFADSRLMEGPSAPPSLDRDIYLAGIMLRKQPGTMLELEGTLMVMKKLREQLENRL